MLILSSTGAALRLVMRVPRRLLPHERAIRLVFPIIHFVWSEGWRFPHLLSIERSRDAQALHARERILPGMPGCRSPGPNDEQGLRIGCLHQGKQSAVQNAGLFRSEPVNRLGKDS